MSTEKYKVGDKVKVKPGLDVLYNIPETNSDDYQQYGGWWFDDKMKKASKALGNVVTILDVRKWTDVSDVHADFYITDCGDFWTDEMLDGLYVENDK